MQVGTLFLRFSNHSCPVASGLAVLVDSTEDLEKIEVEIKNASNEAKVKVGASLDSVTDAIKQALREKAKIVEFHVIEIDTELFL